MAVIHFDKSAKPEYFTSYSRIVLTSIMDTSGVDTVWITSTYRDAHDQASAMARNIETKGAESQRRLYKGHPGSDLVDLYEREKEAVAEANRRGIDTGIANGFAMQRHLTTILAAEISKIGSQKVSLHSGFQIIRNVFDVSATRMPANRRDAFLKAARSDSRVTRIIPPPKDPAFHFEIAQQVGDFNVNPETQATA
jgi:hypothetical protein